MSQFDKIKDVAQDLGEKADDLAEQHGDKIDQGLDKGEKLIKDNVADQHDPKVDAAMDKARAYLDKMQEPEADDAPRPSTP